ncbi:MFS transporter [Thermoleophilia bacterium SCSIO 60948]|nr:MFS transporter [Thermoleophilia bacterium SCSIO 60948]
MTDATAQGPAAGGEKVTPAMRWTLVAMTLSASMILVDQTAVPIATPETVEDLNAAISDGQWILTANIVPLAAFLVLGGRLGDIYGLKRVFLIGAAMFAAATALAGFSQDLPMMLAARLIQGCGAALMMPTSVAIVSATFPLKRRGTALGILAGGSAFFAACGPVMGGLLTSIDWRLVFLINVPLALGAIALTLRHTPNLGAQTGAERVDVPGALTFAGAIGSLIFGLSQGQAIGWGTTEVIVSLSAFVVLLVAFVVVELRSSHPMIEFRLFRHANYLAANISQMLAGVVELGLGFLMPFFMLLVIGVDPAIAGIALIPSTLPIILAGPLAGRVFDKIGGRLPLTLGFLILAGSGVALAIAAGQQSIVALMPGLVLQGIGLGIVLTVNDPTGLTAVPDSDQGQAAGVINTTEQLGGAIGIAALLAVEIGYYKTKLFERLAEKGINPTEEQIAEAKGFILRAEREGLQNAYAEYGRKNEVVRTSFDDVLDAHIQGFELAFYVSSGVALVGALIMFVLVRKQSRTIGPVRHRRSRWRHAPAPGSSVDPSADDRPGATDPT